MENGVENLTSLIPPIKRARDFRLYDFRGRRYVDLYRAGGAALLGHKPRLLVSKLKQTLEKGLCADLPSVYDRRLISALRGLFPAYKTILVGANRSTVLAWCSEYLGRVIGPDALVEPSFSATGTDQPGAVSIWRPFFETQPDAELIIPTLPFGLGGMPVALCAKKEYSPSFREPALSPFLVAGTVHALALLKRTALPVWFSRSLFASSPLFRQNGIYLFPRGTPEDYDRLFRLFLERGFLLSPSFRVPSILPLELSEGELSRLTSLVLNIQ